ncbi:hypothetical protein PRK78_004680 [Emydomyces testavorans]|uniref:Uncharacterized protein n=1 Tax=Emydomyces testavorans TaxID=2070801 RepID=A0AAF0DKN4_9EURO|nr:hypothetical protein PRK78_004680 [Emydomyces testavorans]
MDFLGMEKGPSTGTARRARLKASWSGVSGQILGGFTRSKRQKIGGSANSKHHPFALRLLQRHSPSRDMAKETGHVSSRFLYFQWLSFAFPLKDIHISPTTSDLSSYASLLFDQFKPGNEQECGFESSAVRVLTSPTVTDLSWYSSWLSRQLNNLPSTLRRMRVGCSQLSNETTFNRIFTAVGKYAQENEGISIDEVVEHLRKTEKMDGTSESFHAQRLLVFAILGWQSMLYLPAFNVCSFHELAIHQDAGQPHSGLVFDTYKVSADLADRPLFVLLKAFGNVLPARNPNVTRVASESSKTASSWMPLYPTETNAYLLHTLLRVHIRWVDTLGLHLDYDKSTRTLSLFSCPSLCVAMLQSRGTIYSFASIEKSGIDPRADEEDISQFLQEVLLSLRLLFGQSAASRRLFRQIFQPTETLCHQVDALLPLICTMKKFNRPSGFIPEDRAIYFAARDFPVLYERIELIAKELKQAKPKSMADLLRDRRDTLQYWTFWLISIIGGASILLSFIQVVLQAIQLVRS